MGESDGDSEVKVTEASTQIKGKTDSCIGLDVSLVVENPWYCKSGLKCKRGRMIR